MQITPTAASTVAPLATPDVQAESEYTDFVLWALEEGRIGLESIDVLAAQLLADLGL